MNHKENDLIFNMLSSSSSGSRINYAIQLTKHRGDQVEEAYIKTLNDTSEKMILLACKQLGRLSAKKAIISLLNLLNSNSWNIRLEACKALLSIQGEDVQLHIDLNRVIKTLEEINDSSNAYEYDLAVEEIRYDLGEEYRLEQGSVFGTIPFLLNGAYKWRALLEAK